jgi:hypothetical protein
MPILRSKLAQPAGGRGLGMCCIDRAESKVDWKQEKQPQRKNEKADKAAPSFTSKSQCYNEANN